VGDEVAGVIVRRAVLRELCRGAEAVGRRDDRGRPVQAEPRGDRRLGAPVKVRVESLVGPLVEAWATELELVANNGDISPSSLYVEFDGVAEDEVANQADSVFEAWITFEAESRIEQLAQGEVHAMFLEQHAVIKLRITPEVEE
jgi:hypothetical protein